MEIECFVKDFAGCFEDTDAHEFSDDTCFKDLEEWSSLSGLGIIAMCKKKYGVRITGAEIMESNTVKDVFNLLLSKTESK